VVSNGVTEVKAHIPAPPQRKEGIENERVAFVSSFYSCCVCLLCVNTIIEDTL